MNLSKFGIYTGGRYRLKYYFIRVCTYMGFPGGSVVKNQPTNTGDTGDMGSIPGWGRSPGEGNDNPLQYACLEKSHG